MMKTDRWLIFSWLVLLFVLGVTVNVVLTQRRAIANLQQQAHNAPVATPEATSDPAQPVRLLRSPFSAFWVIADPFQEYGGAYLSPGPSLPDAITKRPCTPGAHLREKGVQGVCVFRGLL
jgi:hypothetical protein